MTYKVTNLTGVDRNVRVRGGHRMVRNGQTKVLDIEPMPSFLIDKWRRVGLRFEAASPGELPTADRPEDEREAIQIPDGWRGLSYNERRSLAAKLSDRPINNAAAADRAIEAEIARRQAKAPRERLVETGQPITPDTPQP